MDYAHFHSLILGLLPCLIPPYALRLSRSFGMQRVGWVLFVVFTLLALLQFVHALQPASFGLDSELTVDLLNFLVPTLLMAAMVHVEILFKGRLRLEQEERRIRSELELEVKRRTADLDRANEELEQEICLRRQGSEELRKSKEQYRYLFEENPQPMWIYELGTFQLLAFNTAALRQYGFTNDEFRQLTAKALFVPAEVEAFVAESATACPRVEARGTWHQIGKDESPIETELTTVDLVYAGRAARLVLANDITAERQLQRRWLHSQKLAITKQLAGGIAESFDRLATGIEEEALHLARTCQYPAGIEPLKRIATSAASIAGLNRQLLTLVGRYPMHLQLFDLREIIEDPTGATRQLIDRRISFKRFCCVDLPPVMADPALVQEMLRILVLNARDAMPEGGSLTLTAAPVQVNEAHARQHDGGRAGAYVGLTVSDTGCGMTPEVQARIFEPFFTTKPNGHTEGLGLAAVEGLAKQHCGWVEVATQPGVGSSFTILFPCAQQGHLGNRTRGLTPGQVVSPGRW